MWIPASPETVNYHREKWFPNSDTSLLIPYGHQKTAVWRVDVRETEEAFSVVYAAGGVADLDVLVGIHDPAIGIKYGKKNAEWHEGFEGVVNIFADGQQTIPEKPNAAELLVFSALLNARYPVFAKGAQLLALDRLEGSREIKLAYDLQIPMRPKSDYYRNLSLIKGN